MCDGVDGEWLWEREFLMCKIASFSLTRWSFFFIRPFHLNIVSLNLFVLIRMVFFRRI